MQDWQAFLVVLLGLGLGIALFFVLPTYLAKLVPQHWHPVILNLVEGLIRLAIFLAYLFLVTRWSEMKRFFAYHGAEHKAIFCFEAGDPLQAESAQRYSTLHPSLRDQLSFHRHGSEHLAFLSVRLASFTAAYRHPADSASASCRDLLRSDLADCA